MYTGPNIVTDGLVLALDAANDKSYVSGSTISNLNLYSQNSLNSYYFTSIVSATTGALAPDGSNTAVLMVEDSTLGIHRWYAFPATNLLSNTLYTFSAYVKSAGRAKGLWFNEWPSGRIGVNYDLGAGTVSPYLTGANTLYTSSITNAGNGWFRLSYTGQDQASLAGAIYDLRLADDSNAFTYTGNGLSGSYFWGVQLEQSSCMTPYLATSGSIGYRDTLFDLSGNNNNGVLVNTPVYNTKNNGNIVFNGSNQLAISSVGTALDIGTTTSITLSCWIKYTSSATNYTGLVAKGFAGSPNAGFQMLLYTNKLSCEVAAGSGVFVGPLAGLLGTTTLNTGQWFNTVLTINRSTNTVSAYVNGVLESAQTTASVGTSNLTTVSNLLIGVERNSSLFFNGSIANVQIYNRALSSIEILQNYNGQKSRFGL
jgi:Concanavalin A-like lectin/glucanases superfamily